MRNAERHMKLVLKRNLRTERKKTFTDTSKGMENVTQQKQETANKKSSQ